MLLLVGFPPLSMCEYTLFNERWSSFFYARIPPLPMLTLEKDNGEQHLFFAVTRMMCFFFFYVAAKHFPLENDAVGWGGEDHKPPSWVGLPPGSHTLPFYTFPFGFGTGCSRRTFFFPPVPQNGLFPSVRPFSPPTVRWLICR